MAGVVGWIDGLNDPDKIAAYKELRGFLIAATGKHFVKQLEAARKAAGKAEETEAKKARDDDERERTENVAKSFASMSDSEAAAHLWGILRSRSDAGVAGAYAALGGIIDKA